MQMRTAHEVGEMQAKRVMNEWHSGYVQAASVTPGIEFAARPSRR